MIPLKFHLTWNSETPVSWLHYMTLESLRYYHPKAEIFLYIFTGASLKQNWKNHDPAIQNAYQGKNYLPTIQKFNIHIKTYNIAQYPECHPAQMSDFIRYDVLFRYGGYYVDMDYLWVQPINKFHQEHQSVDFLISYNTHKHQVLNSLIAAKQFSPIMLYFWNLAKKNFNKYRYESAGTRMLCQEFGHTQWSQKLQQRFPSQHLSIIEPIVFNPFTIHEINQIFQIIKPLSQETIAIHWAAGTAVAQKFIHTLTEDNYDQYPSTFTKEVEKIRTRAT
jgi:hypothetical protein